MKNHFFDQKIFNNLDTPMQKLMNLNVKMMQDLAYMKPMDLFSSKKPDEFFEKQIELFTQNTNTILEYMRNTFNVLQNHWFSVSHDFDQSQQKIIREISTTAEKNIKKSVATAKSAAQKIIVPAEKKLASTAKKTASSTVNKAITPIAKSSIRDDLKTEKKKAKNTASTQTKSSIIHEKQSINQGTLNASTDKNKSNESYAAEKSGAQDLNIQKF